MLAWLKGEVLVQEQALPGDDGRGMVLFIHGLWMHATSWQPWADLFDRSGYDCVLAAWPGERATAGACRSGQAQLSPGGIGQLAGQLTQLAASLPTPPILIGHGVGGLLAQALLGRGVASAAVALAPVPSRLAGLACVAAAARRTTWPGPGIVTSYRRAVMPTAAQFHAGFARALTRAESDALHARYVIPATSRTLIQALLAPAVLPASTDGRGHVGRGPLLLVGGGEDALIPEAAIGALQGRHRRRFPAAVSDHHVFPGRGHSMVIDSRWHEVAYYCLDWLTAQNL
jgi:non-heme chloroperoxidase